jgi:SAM-dependent methyltransferase
MLTREPELMILSDLAVAPVRAIRDAYGLAGTDAPIRFAAIDALDLPLVDASVDVVYGFAFVHHLPDMDAFLREVMRVLRPGGRAVFMDNGYSPVWQHTKTTLLRPLFAYSHRRLPRSPEDVVDTLRGGFKVGDLRPRIEAAGGRPWFVRESFLYYFWHRASRSLFPGAMRRIPRHERIGPRLAAWDRSLSRFRLYRANLIRMVWGFDKP